MASGNNCPSKRRPDSDKDTPYTRPIISHHDFDFIKGLSTIIKYYVLRHFSQNGEGLWLYHELLTLTKAQQEINVKETIEVFPIYVISVFLALLCGKINQSSFGINSSVST